MSRYLVPLRKSDDKSHPDLIRSHPVIAGSPSVGMISGENPLFAAQMQGHTQLASQLTKMGLRFEPTTGHYGAPENSFIVYGPSREQMFHLGHQFGQEAVIYGQQGRHEMLYTNGPKQGKFHPSKPQIDFFTEPPEDYYTEVPGKGYLRLYFDDDQTLDSPLRLGQQPAPAAPAAAPAQAATAPSPTQVAGTKDPQKVSEQASPQPKTPTTDPSQLNRSEINELLHGIYSILKKNGVDVQVPAPTGYPPRPHPHAYAWHDPHTSHHPKVLGPGGIMVSAFLRKAEAPTPHPHTSSYPKNEQHATNDQASKVGISTYAKYAMPYGKVNPGTKSDLTHYPYHGKLPEIERMVKDHGFHAYYAGGKYGRPDLANRNYNTKHLMIYDPSPQSGGDFGEEEYTKGWRQVHELAHALTYPELNQTYGEGRRIGALGKQRTPREALRATHWEWLVAHKQRELSKLLGVHVSDDAFHRELNTVMHDAVHRAITGRFTEPSGEGFVPHSHKVPLETALGMIHEHARNLGLQGMDSTLAKHEGDYAVADDTSKLMTADNFRAGLAKGLHEKLAKAIKVIHEHELRKSAIRKQDGSSMDGQGPAGETGSTASVGNGSMGIGPMAMAERAMCKKHAADGDGEICHECHKPSNDLKEELVGFSAGGHYKDYEKFCPSCVAKRAARVARANEAKKSEEYIDLKNDADPKKRVKNIGTPAGKCPDDVPEKEIAAPGSGGAITKKAEPPMAKPPGKAPTPAAPPTSKPMAKAIPGQMGMQDQQAMVQAHTPKFSAAAPAKPTFGGAPVQKQPIQAQQADVQAVRGKSFGGAPGIGAKPPIQKQPGIPAAGALPKPAAAGMPANKPGIFGRLAASLSKPTPTAQVSPKLPGTP